MTEITSEVIIESSQEQVWKVLTQFDRYGEWNPFLKKIEGVFEAGNTLKVLVQSPGAKERVFFPKVMERKEMQELRWIGIFFLKGLFDGDHRFILEPMGAERTRFIQKEQFRGILVPLNPHIVRGIHRGFEAMNRALKNQVEA